MIASLYITYYNTYDGFMVKINLDNILWGGEQGIPANVYTFRTGNFKRSSTLLKDCPHVKLLKLYEEKGEGLFASELYKETDYYNNICECIQQCGNYFNITDPEDAVRQIKRFIAHYEGREEPRVHQQSDEQDPLVAKNAFSDHYEVIDGIHRLAIAYMKGLNEMECRLSEQQTVTFLQELVIGNKWTPGQQLLYQPIDGPEFDQFTLVRKCTDRLEMMQRLIQEREWEMSGKKYLDLGCSYGYFMAGMEAEGMKSYGVDNCPNSILLAQICYNQPKERLLCLSLENFFEMNEETYEVVSLLSVLHHFMLNRGQITAEELIRNVDTITGRVLFLDSGQNHEEWFKDSLPELDETALVKWLKEHTSFDEVIALGKDTDNVGVYSPNYQRSLIACIRK